MRHYIRDEDVDKNIGTVLRVLCVTSGKKLGDVATEAGITTRSSLYDRINGKRRFSAAEVARIARVLGVAPGRFYEPPTSLTDTTPPSRCIARSRGHRRFSVRGRCHREHIIARPLSVGVWADFALTVRAN